MQIARWTGLRMLLSAVVPTLVPWVAAAMPLTGHLLVLSEASGGGDYRIIEYSADGTGLQIIVPQPAPGSGDVAHPRDLVTSPLGEIHLYNGTFEPYMSTHDPALGSWSHATHAEWSTVNNVSYGGIARSGDRVFVTDMSTANGTASGIVVFDTVLGSAQRIASGIQATDLNLGLDGRLWVLDEDGSVYAFDPVTLAAVGSVSTAASGGTVRALAVAASGDFYLATWEGFVAHLDPGGNLVDTLSIGRYLTDIDLAPSGLLAIGTWLDGSWLSDTTLSGAQQIESGRWDSFVAFVPEPDAGPLLAAGVMLIASLGRRPRR
jgi:hypothetical protein